MVSEAIFINNQRDMSRIYYRKDAMQRRVSDRGEVKDLEFSPKLHQRFDQLRITLVFSFNIDDYSIS